LFTKEEEIFRMFHRINAMTRMHPRHKCDNPHECGNHHPTTPPHEHGRGRMLGLLADEGEMNQAHLAARLEIRPQSLSEFLVKAEEDGLIVRRQSDEDKRQTIVSLTEEGKRRVETFRDAHKRHAEDFLSALSDQEKEELAVILSKLIESKQNKGE